MMLSVIIKRKDLQLSKEIRFEYHGFQAKQHPLPVTSLVHAKDSNGFYQMTNLRGLYVKRENVRERKDQEYIQYLVLSKSTPDPDLN